MIAVLVDELRRFRLLFLAALVAGVLPAVVPWLPFRATSDPTLPSLMAVLFSIGFGLAAAWAAGLRLLSEDLARGRVGFYLAQPITVEALWAGRWVAAGGSVAGAMLAAVLPAALTPWAGGLRGLRSAVPRALALESGPVEIHGWWPGAMLAEVTRLRNPSEVSLALLVVCGLLTAVALAHICGMAFRLKSSWSLLDLSGLGIWAGTVALAVHTLREVSAWAAIRSIGVASSIALFVAVFVIGWLQLRRAGALPVQSHRVFSKALAVWLVIVCLGLWAFASRSLRPSFEAIDRVLMAHPVGGGWAFVVGEVRGTGALHLYLVETLGTNERYLGTVRDLPFAPAHDRDGRRLAWTSCNDAEPAECEIHVLDLEDAATGTLTATRLVVPLRNLKGPRFPRFVFDDTGRFLAVPLPFSIMVADLEKRQWLAHQTFESPSPGSIVTAAGDGRWHVQFVDPAKAPGLAHLQLEVDAGWIDPDSESSEGADSSSNPRKTSAQRNPPRLAVRHSPYLDNEVVDLHSGRIAWAIAREAGRYHDLLVLDRGQVVALRPVEEPGAPPALALDLWREGVISDSLLVEGEGGFLGQKAADGTFWVGLGRGPLDAEAADRCSPPGRPPAGAKTAVALRIDPDGLRLREEVEGFAPSSWRSTSAAGWLHDCDGWPWVLENGDLRTIIAR